jgi:hypothetical protein
VQGSKGRKLKFKCGYKNEQKKWGWFHKSWAQGVKGRAQQCPQLSGKCNKVSARRKCVWWEIRVKRNEGTA